MVFEHERGVFSALSKACSYIDHYSHWSNIAYSEVALNFWSITQSEFSTNTETLSFLAAHIHQTSHQMMHMLFPEKASWLVNPECYMYCLQLSSQVFKCLKKDKEVYCQSAYHLQHAPKAKNEKKLLVDALLPLFTVNGSYQKLSFGFAMVP